MITHITRRMPFAYNRELPESGSEKNALALFSKYCPRPTRLILSRTLERTLWEANRESRRPKEEIVF